MAYASHDDAGSYLESRCTAVFGYGILKGINKGLLDPKCKETTGKPWLLLMGALTGYEN